MTQRTLSSYISGLNSSIHSMSVTHTSSAIEEKLLRWRLLQKKLEKYKAESGRKPMGKRGDALFGAGELKFGYGETILKSSPL